MMSRTIMFADREVVRDCDAEYFNGGDARNIRQCGWQVTVLKLAPAAGKYYFQRCMNNFVEIRLFALLKVV